MRVEDAYYFECLRCGAQSPMTESPPRCPKCNSGNGIVTERELPHPVTPTDAATQAMRV
jgi:Zn finger protein HypA/HybF involved in hydrogenase expression